MAFFTTSRYRTFSDRDDLVLLRFIQIEELLDEGCRAYSSELDLTFERLPELTYSDYSQTHDKDGLELAFAFAGSVRCHLAVQLISSSIRWCVAGQTCRCFQCRSLEVECSAYRRSCQGGVSLSGVPSLRFLSRLSVPFPSPYHLRSPLSTKDSKTRTVLRDKRLSIKTGNL